MKKLTDPILNLFRFHKLKMLLFVGLYLVFSVLFFPFNDLGDMVSAKVSELSGNQVFLSFSNMSFSVIPQPGLDFENIQLDTPYFPTLKADALALAPSITGLLTFKPGISATADGLFKGSVNLSTRGDKKTKANVMSHLVDLELSKVDLNPLTKFIQTPVELGGRLDFETSAVIDPTFVEQPDGDFNGQIRAAQLLPSNLQTPIGPFALPGLDFKKIEFEGSMKGGTIKIAKAVLGDAQDELRGSVKGQIDLKMYQTGAGFQAIPGAYDFSIEIEVLPSLETRMGSMWSLLEGFIENYKRSSSPDKKSFAFRVSGQSVMNPPKISPYQ